MEILLLINNLKLARKINVFSIHIEKLSQPVARLNLSLVGREPFIYLVKIYQVVALTM